MSYVVVNILADDNPPAVQVASIGQEGIQLVDGLKIPGPCVFLEGRVFLWDTPTIGEGKDAWKEWKEEHFELFDTVVPAPGKLHGILGIGQRILPVAQRSYCLELAREFSNRRRSSETI